MADLVTGAMGSIVPKLYELLKEEYDLQTGVKQRISSLTKELEHAQAALCKVAEVLWDQLDKQVQIWARKVREASYDMEDVLDTFLMHVKGPDSTEEKRSLNKYLKEVTKFFMKSKARRKISGDVKDIMSHLQEVTEQCRRYKVDDIVAKPATPSTVDPRLHAMYTHVSKLVGVDKSSEELMSMLPQRGDVSSTKMKIVSIVGVGGLGKTTLAKVVYDKIKGDFNCRAFVSVGRNPDLQKVLQIILVALDKETYQKFNFSVWQDITQFIDELREFLQQNKRYIIVIDDIWDIPSWEVIKLAIGDDNNSGARIIITTRKQQVANKADEVYKLRPLPDDISGELFFTRIGGDEGKLVDNNNPDEGTVNKFLKKCDGIPLAIITMASLLAGKPSVKWDELYRSIGFGGQDNEQAENTMRIVSFSYYDLPVHLRTCLLYLSAFPEDSDILKDPLVWMWVAEGFVEKKQDERLFETGEGYFHDLINRSMLEAVKSIVDDSIVTGCRVHDMVLDFIRSISEKENFFSVASGDVQGTLLESNNVQRRLAYHDRTLQHGHGRGVDLKMAKVRSLFAIGCRIEASNPFYGFTLLRVLVIDNNWKATNNEGRLVFRNEHVRRLLHLRFLKIRGTSVESIPEEIGRLRFLQTLDMEDSYLHECPSPGSIPEQLVCLRLSHHYIGRLFDDITWLTGLTTLEELSISVSSKVISWCLPTVLLRVLQLRMDGDRCNKMDFWETVRHMNKLEVLSVHNFGSSLTDFVLPSSLRHFSTDSVFSKLPPCLNAACLPNLSHLDLQLQHMDEHDLETLGRLPELRFLGLDLWAPDTVSSVVVVSEKDAAVVYFPKLRCCQLEDAVISIDANEEDKSISFQMWGGGIVEKEVQRPIITPCSIGGGGSSCASGSATRGGAPRHRFMPCLQVFRFDLSSHWEHSFDKLGLEYGFPSLREICVFRSNASTTTAVLRSAAEAHPNRPAFHEDLW